MISPYRNRLPMAYLPASRAVDTVGMHPMFYGRVSGVGSMGPRPVDPTETEFEAVGKIHSTRTWDHPTYGKQTVSYPLVVTVKNYVPGSGQVSYTTWGKGLYPGFNLNPNWQTVSEAEFISMYPDWVAVRNAKFGAPAPAPVPAPAPSPAPIPTPKPTGSALPLLLGAAFLLLS